MHWKLIQAFSLGHSKSLLHSASVGASEWTGKRKAFVRTVKGSVSQYTISHADVTKEVREWEKWKRPISTGSEQSGSIYKQAKQLLAQRRTTNVQKVNVRMLLSQFPIWLIIAVSSGPVRPTIPPHRQTHSKNIMGTPKNKSGMWPMKTAKRNGGAKGMIWKADWNPEVYIPHHCYLLLCCVSINIYI